MKTEHETLLKKLALIAPNIAVNTEWAHDDDSRWDCDSDELDPNDFQCWQSEVVASAIAGGKLIHGSASLCGTWEKFGDHPRKSNPEISGYFLQMAEEAYQELKGNLPKTEHALHAQCELACGFLNGEMRKRHDRQMACRDIATA